MGGRGVGVVVGISLMNREHLVERRGPRRSPGTDALGGSKPNNPRRSSSLSTATFRPPCSVDSSSSPVVPPVPLASSKKKKNEKKNQPQIQRNHASSPHPPLRLNYLFPPMPTVNPGALAVGFSDSLALLSQVEHACGFLPAKFISPASGSGCEVIRERGLQPSDPAATLFSVK